MTTMRPKPIELSRRHALALGIAAAAGACEPSPPPPRRRGPTAAAVPPAAPLPWREVAFAKTAAYPAQRATLLPLPAAPLLVALHGRGEAGRGLAAGARGWRDDYQLGRAHRRLLHPPLTRDDFYGFVQAPRLAQMNASLAAVAYRGVTVVCPYTPIVRDRSVKGAQPFAAFVVGPLLARARQLAKAALGVRCGIDGVSMGGRLALLVGLSHASVFSFVGAMQPAIGVGEADALAALAARAVGQHGTQVRLLSSHGDPFLAAVRALSQALHKRAVPHQLVVTPGPHDYVYNRGPGAYEMLLWHERGLRGGRLPPPQ